MAAGGSRWPKIQRRTRRSASLQWGRPPANPAFHGGPRSLVAAIPTTHPKTGRDGARPSNGGAASESGIPWRATVPRGQPMEGHTPSWPPGGVDGQRSKTGRDEARPSNGGGRQRIRHSMEGHGPSWPTDGGPCSVMAAGGNSMAKDPKPDATKRVPPMGGAANESDIPWRATVPRGRDSKPRPLKTDATKRVPPAGGAPTNPEFHGGPRSLVAAIPNHDP